MLKKLDYWIPITVAIWTILQCLVHLWWVIYGRNHLTCDIKVESSGELYNYFTYLFGNNCNLDSISNQLKGIHITNVSDSIDVDADLTRTLMCAYVVLDALWIITSVALLFGTIVRIKECLAFLIFTPWIIIDLSSLCLDVYCAIYYASKSPKSHQESITIEESSLDLPFTTIMALVSSRLGIIWLINFILIFFIIRTTYKAYKSRYSDERMRLRHTANMKRVQDWNLYYDDLNYSASFHEGGKMCSTFKDSSSLPTISNESKDIDKHVPWSYTNGKLPKKVVVVVEPYVCRTSDGNRM